MPQIRVDASSIHGDVFFLDKKESHHVVNVLRNKIGDLLYLFDGKGRKYVGEISAIDASKILSGRIIKELPVNQKKVRLTLFQGVPKGSKFDYVIEKAVELGVDAIVPFFSEKNPVQPSDGSSKLLRWERLVEAAAKQCGRADLPVLAPPASLKTFESQIEKGLTLLFSIEENTPLLKTFFSNFQTQVENINLLIGPESGFSKSELDWLLSKGGHAVSLGGNVLRTETAGLVALSLVNYELGLL